MDERSLERIEQLERRVASMQRQLGRRPRLARWGGLAALGAVALLPMLAWTYAKPHPDFEPGMPISSAEVNATVDDVYTALNTLDTENGRVAASTAVDAVGPLPVSGGFDSQGGTVMLFVSGSAWRAGAVGSGFAGVEVAVDGTGLGQVRTFTNETGSHKAIIPTPFIVPDLAAGAHTVDVTAIPNTSTDSNDSFVIVALELPR